MIKTLTRQGNSAALIFDKTLMELLGIDMQTPLKLTVHGRRLVIEPLSGKEREAKFDDAMVETGKQYAKAFRKLAE
jgi:antitoxin component of MazEF toxin-antitoxin module